MKILDFLNIFSRFKFNIFNITLNYTWNLGLLQKLRIRKKKHKNIIHCIGDSHVTFFSGFHRVQSMWPIKSFNKFSFLKSYRLGPVLAYNLCSFKTRFNGREKLLYLSSHILPLGCKVLFCFGEIDCRAHIIKQVEISGKDIHEIIRECVDRYFSVIKETKEKGFDILVFNVIPSGIIDQVSYKPDDFPFYGTNLERNKVSKYFNKYLEQKLNKHNIIFIDIIDKLVFENYETNPSYFFDSAHLGQKAMPLFVNELLKKCPDLYRFMNII